MPGTFSPPLLVSDPGMHHDTYVMHVPWCMSGSLIRCGRKNVPGMSGVCATRNFTYLARGPWITPYVFSTYAFRDKLWSTHFIIYYTLHVDIIHYEKFISTPQTNLQFLRDWNPPLINFERGTNSLPPGRCGSHFTVWILQTLQKIVAATLDLKLRLEECNKTLLLISLGAFRQQAIIWANVTANLCHH